jgi:hypothetical protein
MPRTIRHNVLTVSARCRGTAFTYMVYHGSLWCFLSTGLHHQTGLAAIIPLSSHLCVCRQVTCVDSLDKICCQS